MLAQGVGKIINTASMASLLVPHPQKQAAYNASKAAGGCEPLCACAQQRLWLRWAGLQLLALLQCGLAPAYI